MCNSLFGKMAQNPAKHAIESCYIDMPYQLRKLITDATKEIINFEIFNVIHYDF